MKLKTTKTMDHAHRLLPQSTQGPEAMMNPVMMEGPDDRTISITYSGRTFKVLNLLGNIHIKDNSIFTSSYCYMTEDKGSGHNC